jgi:ELWxxDGT repeat protein
MMISRKIFIFILLLLFGRAESQVPILLKDINVTADPSAATLGSDPRFLTNHNGTLFFTAKTNGATTSLWKTNGKASGTIKVTDLPGTAYSLTSVGNTLFFVADQPNYGLELWKSDGTASGTIRIKDIYSGSLGSMPSGLTNVNGVLYFVANTAANGSELWKSNGTDATTLLVKDIAVGSWGGNPQSLINVNGTLFFVASDGINGYELWKSNGTAAGTVMVKDINVGVGSSSPGSLTNVNGVLYFTANNGINGYELWKSDGTANGTVMVKDIWAGSANAMPHFLTNVNGTLYFAANDGQRGLELWKSNGTSVGTTLVTEIQQGSVGGEPRHLRNIKGILYFSATNGTTGQEFWRSDGTAAGTYMIKNIRVGGEGSYSSPNMFTSLKNEVYFTANDGYNGQELWKSDGTEAGTKLVYDLKEGEGGSGISSMVAVADTIYFMSDDGKKGGEIWKVESCLDLKLITSDTTICSKSAVSLPALVTNYNVFSNQVWRIDSLDGQVVSNVTNVIPAIGTTVYHLTAQLGQGCTSTTKVTVNTIAYPQSVGSIRVLLEGPYQAGTGNMTTKLNQQGLLPGQTPTNPLGVKTLAKQPYFGFPWYYNDSETTGNYSSNITDWVLVSLRTNPADPSTTVFKSAAMLQNDGLVSTITGCPNRLKNQTNYYVAVEHRNHIGVVSANPKLFINNGFFYDFTISQSYIPPNIPAVGQKKIGNRFVMYAGDFQKSVTSHEINVNDKVIWQSENGLFGRYFSSDANMDGEVNALDKTLWILNNGLYSGVKF